MNLDDRIQQAAANLHAEAVERAGGLDLNVHLHRARRRRALSAVAIGMAVIAVVLVPVLMFIAGDEPDPVAASAPAIPVTVPAAGTTTAAPRQPTTTVEASATTTTEPPSSVAFPTSELITGGPVSAVFGDCLHLEHWAGEEWTRTYSARLDEATQGIWTEGADLYCTAGAVINGERRGIELPADTDPGIYRLTGVDGESGGLIVRFVPPACEECATVAFDPSAAPSGIVTVTGTGFSDLAGETVDLWLVGTPYHPISGYTAVDADLPAVQIGTDGSFETIISIDPGLLAELTADCPPAPDIQDAADFVPCPIGEYWVAVEAHDDIAVGEPLILQCCGAADALPLRGLAVPDADGYPQGEPGIQAALVGVIISRDQESRICGFQMDSHPPQCGEPSVLLIGFDPSRLPWVERARGVTWTEGVVVAGTWEEGGFRAEHVERIVVGGHTLVSGVVLSGDDGLRLCTIYDTSELPECIGTPIPLVDADPADIPIAGSVDGVSWTEPVIVTGTWAEGGIAADSVAPDPEGDDR